MYRCSVHGVSSLNSCLVCETSGWIQKVKDGLIKSPVLSEGDGPLPQDPTLLEITFRSIRLRQMREDGYDNKLHWEHVERIINIVHDPTLEPEINGNNLLDSSV